MSKFGPHGSIDAYWEGDVLVVVPSGDINIETVHHTNADMRAVTALFPKNDWCRLDYFESDDILLTSDSVIQLEESFKANKRDGCIKIGIVGGNVVISLLFERLCKKNGIEFERYDSLATGICYLSDRARSKLLPTSSND